MDLSPCEQFISERILPVPGTASTAGMSRGEPGLPAEFTWRDRRYRVLDILQAWKTSGPCRSGADEVYLRRHWYRIRTDPAAVMTLYFQRQAGQPRRPKARWWIYSITELSQPCTSAPASATVAGHVCGAVTDPASAAPSGDTLHRQDAC